MPYIKAVVFDKIYNYIVETYSIGDHLAAKPFNTLFLNVNIKRYFRPLHCVFFFLVKLALQAFSSNLKHIKIPSV